MARVVGLNPSTSAVHVVLVEGDAATFTVPFHDEWKLSNSNRFEDYAQIRKRLAERLAKWQPDAVCITAIEPVSFRHAKASWFQTAELRGVLSEVAQSTGCTTEQCTAKVVGDALGTRTAEQYRKDDAFWSHLGTDFLKKYRDDERQLLLQVNDNYFCRSSPGRWTTPRPG